MRSFCKVRHLPQAISNADQKNKEKKYPLWKRKECDTSESNHNNTLNFNDWLKPVSLRNTDRIEHTHQINIQITNAYELTLRNVKNLDLFSSRQKKP